MFMPIFILNFWRICGSQFTMQDWTHVQHEIFQDVIFPIIEFACCRPLKVLLVNITIAVTNCTGEDIVINAE